MLKNLIILAFCVIAINASGKVNFMKYPDSLSFKGDEKLDSDSLGDVVSASLGHCVDDEAPRWNGLFIKDVFNLPQSALVVIVQDVEQMNFNSKVKSYPMTGSSSEESMNAVSSELESAGIQTCSIVFDQSSDARSSMADCFGEIPAQEAPAKATNSLKPDLHSEDKDFLTQLAYIKELFSKHLTSIQRPNLLTVRISLEPIAKAHGEKSQALADARKMLSNLLEDSSADIGDLLFIVATEKPESNRAKRQTENPGGANDVKSLNLATYYGEDYPVIFNMILWFMVIMAFSIIAICHVIASMDPGRDSIIYRMTSTRMKKDN